jgi:hypothetical protein
MMAYGEVKVTIHICLISTLHGDEMSAFRSGCFITVEGTPSTYFIACLDPRARLDTVTKRKVAPPIVWSLTPYPVSSLHYLYQLKYRLNNIRRFKNECNDFERNWLQVPTLESAEHRKFLTVPLALYTDSPGGGHCPTESCHSGPKTFRISDIQWNTSLDPNEQHAISEHATNIIIVITGL